MKRIIAIVLSLATLVSLSSMRTHAIDNTEDELFPEYCEDYTVVPAAIPDEVIWITNEDGVAETQEIFYLPEDGSLPSYITDIEYLDEPTHIPDNEEFPDEDDIYTPIDEEYSAVNIPLRISLKSGNNIFTDEIMLTESMGGAETHIQIYDPEDDVSVYDADFPISEVRQITLSEGREYWISLVSDYGTYYDSYYGTIVAFEGILEITGGWHFTTNKADLVADENDIELYGSIMNEQEPNDSQYTATVYKNDADMYGTISRTTDVDYYKVDFQRDGKANFFLGNIPKDCNYNMKIYYQSVSGGGLYLYRSLVTSGAYAEVLNLPIESDKVYYMQVYSSKGSSTTEKYTVRAKIVSTTDDSYEPNNTFAAAKKISANGYIDATIHKSTDVDYYVVNCLSNGILDITLSNIPGGCDYRYIVYDSNKSQIAQMVTSGSAKKELSISVGYGNYYIKVYSQSGSNQTMKYRLKTATRSSYTTISGYIHPKIKTSGNSSYISTSITNLPVQIIHKPDNSSNETILSKTTTNSIGKFSVSFSLPSKNGILCVKIFPNDSNLSIEKADATVSSFLYEIPLAASNISFDTDNFTMSPQMLASMSLWNLGKQCLTTYSAKGSYNPNNTQLIMRCTAGTKATTQTVKTSTSHYITINGQASQQDYYDYDGIFHEFGHWIMNNMNGRPDVQKGLAHTWLTATLPGKAYIEGWAHYFSCAMRNKSTVYDYNSSGQYTGGNLETGYAKDTFTGTMSQPVQANYKENMKFEIFVGSALWNLYKNIGTSYNLMESIMGKKCADWQAFYDKYMNAISATKRKEAWKLCDKFKVAFDMKCPNVTLTISDSNLVANMTATDDISVESYEWYIDGIKKSSMTGTSVGTLDLKNLGLKAGQHIVECRVYDPEGLATGNRPRVTRFGSAMEKFVVPKAGITADTNDLNQDPPIAIGQIYSQPDFVSLPLGADYSYPVNSFGNMDIEVSMSASGAVKAIDIYTPNGELYDSLPYIAPDTPYIIENAEAGEWIIAITNYSTNELMDMAYNQGVEISYDTICEFPNIDLWISATPIPTIVDVEAPMFTNNPYILTELFNEDGIIITEHGQIIDSNIPLSDGTYEFTAIRELGGLYSEEMEYLITVDTTAPEITVIDLPISTSRDRCLLQAEFSEDVASVIINGEEIELGCCGGSAGYTDALMLKPGVNWFSLSVTDYAGNSNNQTFSVERVA